MTRIAAVRALAAPHDTANVAALESALNTIAEELRSARGVGHTPND